MAQTQVLSNFKINPELVQRTLAVLPILIGIISLFLIFSGDAIAQAMPWEGTLCRVAISLQGPVARSVAVIAIVVSGLMLAVGEVSGVFKTMLQLLFGISMAILANQWIGFIGGSGSLGTC